MSSVALSDLPYLASAHALLQSAGAYRPDYMHIPLSQLPPGSASALWDMSHVCAWAIFFFSKEVICDFIMDARFPADTLFIVLEEDYRFWPVGEDPQGCDDYQERLQKILQEEDALRRSGAYRPDEDDFSVEAGGEGEHTKVVEEASDWQANTTTRLCPPPQIHRSRTMDCNRRSPI